MKQDYTKMVSMSQNSEEGKLRCKLNYDASKKYPKGQSFPVEHYIMK